MSFFDSLPRPEPPEPPAYERPRWMRSDTVIPGSVPGDVILVRTEHVAVAAGGVRAYPNGFEFTLQLRVRADGETGDLTAGHPFGEQWRRGPWAGEGTVRLGILYADGRRTATGAGHPGHDDDYDAGRLILMEGGGGGDERSWRTDFWVHPLPPDGPVTLIVSWLDRGVAETRAELDGTAIRATAQRAVVLWPEEPGQAGRGGWTSSTYTGSGPGADREQT